MTMTDHAQAWMVIGADGYKMPFLDRVTAHRYSKRVNGVVKPLFYGRRREDDQPIDEAEAPQQQWPKMPESKLL